MIQIDFIFSFILEYLKAMIKELTSEEILKWDERGKGEEATTLSGIV